MGSLVAGAYLGGLALLALGALALQVAGLAGWLDDGRPGGERRRPDRVAGPGER